MPIRLRFRLPPFDTPLALSALGLVAIGLAMVYSATSVPGAHEGLWVKQLLWAVVAFGAAMLVAAVDHRVYASIAWPLYAVSLLLLVAVLVFGETTMGAVHWKRYFRSSAP